MPRSTLPKNRREPSSASTADERHTERLRRSGSFLTWTIAERRIVTVVNHIGHRSLFSHYCQNADAVLSLLPPDLPFTATAAVSTAAPKVRLSKRSAESREPLLPKSGSEKPKNGLKDPALLTRTICSHDRRCWRNLEN